MKKIKYSNLGYYAVALLFAMLMAGYRRSNLLWDPIGDRVFIALAWFKPIVYRALIPFTAKYFYYVFNIQPNYSFVILECLGFFLAIIMYRKYLHLFIKSDILSKILSFTLMFIVPFEMLLFRHNPQWFPFDVWAMFFTIALLYLMYTENYLLYILVFIVGTINRETTIVITGIGVLFYWKQRANTKLRNSLIIQIAAWIIVKYILYSIFADRPGWTFHDKYMSNWQFISDPSYLKAFSDPWIEMIFRIVFLIGNFGFIWILIIKYSRLINNAFLSRAVFIIIPFYLGMLYVADIFEYRIFAEFIPIILTPVLVIIIELMRGEIQTNNQVLN
jgi:hypothetical protein